MQNHKKLNLLFILIILFKIVAAVDLEIAFKKLPASNFGVPASSPQVQAFAAANTVLPRKSPSDKSYLTFNKMGFDVLNTEGSNKSWLVNDFLTFSKKSQKPLLDVGSGYGQISLQILKNKKIAISNDISVEHLLITIKYAIENKLPLKNLYLNNHIFPDTMEFPDNSLDGVILHRILHFLPGKKIEIGLAKIYKWLQPNGKIFIVVMAPQHNEFSNWFLPIYDRKWQEGNAWPGEKLAVKKALPDQAYNLPKFLHVMDERPLRRALENSGFTVEKVAYISMGHFSKGNDKGAIGIIARKKITSL